MEIKKYNDFLLNEELSLGKTLSGTALTLALLLASCSDQPKQADITLHSGSSYVFVNVVDIDDEYVTVQDNKLGEVKITCITYCVR